MSILDTTVIVFSELCRSVLFENGVQGGPSRIGLGDVIDHFFCV